jgi:hypothetical protein
MRVESERSREVRRWSIETTGALDRAIAALVTVIALAIAQLTGLSTVLLNLVMRGL